MKDDLLKSSMENQSEHANSLSTNFIDKKKKIFKIIDVKRISPNPFQPRKNITNESISELKKSIEITGLIQPIVIREVDGDYQIIAGERRFRSALELEHKEIECFIIELSDKESAEYALIENIERESLSDFEIGKALRKMEEKYLKLEDLAKVIGIARPNIYKYWAYDALPVECIEILEGSPKSLQRKSAVEIQKALNDLEKEGKKEKAFNFLISNFQNLVDQKITTANIIKKLNSFKNKTKSPSKENSGIESITMNNIKIGEFKNKNGQFSVSFKKGSISKDATNAIIEFIKERAESDNL